jgi:hypothetical protein
MFLFNNLLFVVLPFLLTHTKKDQRKGKGYLYSFKLFLILLHTKKNEGKK